jgi:hypothetical protein
MSSRAIRRRKKFGAWWEDFDVIEIYIGMFSGGWALNGCTQGWSSHDVASQALERWTQEIAERHASRWRKARVVLWLSGGLARPYLCGPVSGLTSWREAEAFAVAAAPEATGFEGPCRVQLEDWPGDVPALGTAIDVALAESIHALARSRRIVWRSVRPRWAAVLGEALAHRPSLSVFALAEEDGLTLLGGPPLKLPATSSSAIDLAATYSPAPNPSQAMAIWHRMLLSRDLPPDDAWFAHLEAIAQGDQSGFVEDVGNRTVWPSATRQAEAPVS